MNGATSKIIAYASIETNEGISINGISIRQDIQNKSIIKVIFPCKKLHNETQPFISFSSKLIEKEIVMSIMLHLREAMSKEINKENEK